MGHRCNQPATVVAHNQMQRVPAGISTHRFASLKCCQKGVADKGILGTGNAIPIGGGNAAYIVT